MASPIKNSDKGGKKPGQKFKSLLVWNLLLKRTDETHAARITEIQELLADYGIEAERHSIARDIEAVNELFSADLDADIEERDHLGYEIAYDQKKHGYKIVCRPYTFEELRLLAECVRATKFISKHQEEHLLTTIEDLCSKAQIEELKNDVYLVGRSKTDNDSILSFMMKIKPSEQQKNWLYLFETHAE